MGEILRKIIPILKQEDMQQRDADGNTPLHLASQSDMSEYLSILLEKSLDMSIKNNEGKVW